MSGITKSREALIVTDWVGQIAAAVTTWIAGETGRAMVAGAAGGLLRWLGQESKRLLDGIGAVTTGAICALYLGPVVGGALGAVGIHLGDGANADSAAGFLAGLAGMSLAKVAIALIETWAARQIKGGNDGQP